MTLCIWIYSSIWLINFNGMSTCLVLFYSKRIGKLFIVHLYLHFLCSCFLRVLNTVIWNQVFLSNTNNLYTVVWFQVFLSNTHNFKQMYLTCRWGTSHSRAPELESHKQMFNFIHRLSSFCGAVFTFLQGIESAYS